MRKPNKPQFPQMLATKVANAFIHIHSVIHMISIHTAEIPNKSVKIKNCQVTYFSSLFYSLKK